MPKIILIIGVKRNAFREFRARQLRPPKRNNCLFFYPEVHHAH